MKSKEVLKLLKVSRVTLSSYVKTGKIKVTKLSNGYYNYNDDSVYQFLGKQNRYNVIYARVSTYKQKSDLKRQIKKLSDYCNTQDIAIEYTFSDISSGIDLERPHFSNLLEMIFNKQIDTIYITYKDRLTRLSYSVLKSIFKKFGTKIIPIYHKEQENYDELFDEVTSLMHYFSTKQYSKRRSN